MSQCTFPVCPSSPPECIFEAFLESGYYYQLNDQQRQAAQRDPRGWLLSHPYLYGAYPNYFSQTCTGYTQPSSPSGGGVGGGGGGGGGGSDWLKPFEEFGGWLLQVGQGITNFINTVGNVYAEMVTATGRYPIGAIILIVFIIVLAVLFKVII